MSELIIKKCNKCGATIKVLKDCTCNDCGIKCCNEEMKEIKANSVDASFEKHLPTYEIKDNKLCVKVNHVMEEEHYIKWISQVTDDKEITKYLNPNEEAVVEFEYIKGSKIYSYCNKHGLWMTEVK